VLLSAEEDTKLTILPTLTHTEDEEESDETLKDEVGLPIQHIDFGEPL